MCREEAALKSALAAVVQWDSTQAELAQIQVSERALPRATLTLTPTLTRTLTLTQTQAELAQIQVSERALPRAHVVTRALRCECAVTPPF